MEDDFKKLNKRLKKDIITIGKKMEFSQEFLENFLDSNGMQICIYLNNENEFACEIFPINKEIREICLKCEKIRLNK